MLESPELDPALVVGFCLMMLQSMSARHRMSGLQLQS